MAHLAPSVVLSDIVLGKMDGLRFVRDARRKGYDVPFVAVSGKDVDVQHLVDAGLAAFVPKPIDHRKLLDTILAVIRSR